MPDMVDWILENIDRQFIEDPGQIDPPFKEEKQMPIVKRKMPAGNKNKKIARVSDGPVLDLTLPTERSTPSTRMGDYTTLLFGEKKIGKTSLTAQYPKTIHLMLEPGGKALTILQRPVGSWKEYLGYVKLLKKDKSFATVSVDTADILYAYCFEYVTNKMGIDHPADEAFGKGWKAIRDEFERGVMALINTGKGIMFISHATEREIKMRDGATYDRIQPTMAGQARDVLEGLVDLWFYYGYDGSRRTLTIQGSDHIGAGHRLENNFKTPDGAPVTEIDMGGSAAEGYANLVAAFQNKYTPRKRKEDDEPTTVVKKKKKLSLKKKD